MLISQKLQTYNANADCKNQVLSNESYVRNRLGMHIQRISFSGFKGGVFVKGVKNAANKLQSSISPVNDILKKASNEIDSLTLKKNAKLEKLKTIDGTDAKIRQESERQREYVENNFFFTKKKIKGVNEREMDGLKRNLEKKDDIVKKRVQISDNYKEVVDDLSENIGKHDPEHSLKLQKEMDVSESAKGKLKDLKGFEKIAGYEREKRNITGKFYYGT